MKNILKILIIFSFIPASACSCIHFNFTDKFTRSDFVAEIRINQVYKNAGEKELYKSDIEILNLYKGDSISSIYVAGRSDGKMGSSCAIFIPEGTKLIAYGYKDKEGKYIIGMCSGLTYFNNHYYVDKNRIRKERKMMAVLEKNDIELNHKISFDTNGSLYDKLDQFDGIDLDKNFALFEITFSSDLKVKQIEILSGFKKSLNKKLMDILKSSEWRSFKNGNRYTVPKDTKMLFEIHYYPGEKGSKSFLSPHFL